MSELKTPEEILEKIHLESGANQSALYYLAYPKLDRLVLCVVNGDNKNSDRYWRNQINDMDTVRHIHEAPAPFSFSGESVIGKKEHLVAVPITSGENVIGAVVHCYFESKAKSYEALYASVQNFSRDFFHGWVDFLVAEKSRPLSVLFHIAGTISASLDLDRVLLSVVEQATILFRAKMSSLMLADEDKKELEMVTAYGCSLEYIDKPNVPVEGSILGKVVRDNQVIQLENLFNEPLYLHRDYAKREGVYSLLAAPISFQKSVLGVLNIYSAVPRRWQRSEIELLQTFANHAAIAITNVRVHEQIMSMEEQLQVSAKLSTLGELAAGLSHEIRNPLAVINMLIHSWKSAPPKPEDFEHDLDVVSQKISDLNLLVKDLLHMARNRPLDRQKQNIEVIIDRVLRLLRHRIRQQRVQIKKKINLNDLEISIDRERIEQAILNLLLNALDATPEGGTITVELFKQENQFSINISDTGCGIPESQLSNIFKAFHTTKQRGTGLGLPMTRRMVEEHKGKVFVSKNDPHGATFTILLPLDSHD